jgi:hypothetical protein
MLRATFVVSSVRRVAIMLGALSLVLIVGAVQASASTAGAAKRRPTINTLKDWQGSTVIPFGCPDTTTYGQTFTVPGHKTTMDKVTWVWSGTGGSMVVRGELYAWDGTKATGSALFETAPRTIAFADSAFHHVSFNFHGASVTPGHQYVVFASIDKDYEQCSNYTVAWGATDDSAYAGGTFVFQNNSGNEANWTTVAWNGAGIDSAFKAYLGT